VGRYGLRIGDLYESETVLRERLAHILEAKNSLIEKCYPHLPTHTVDELYEWCRHHAEKLAPFVADTIALVHESLEKGWNILFEGAQGTLLDVDYGTYPFVTSSNATAGGACTGSGIGPTRIDRVIGVMKAYTTRVGEGPLPTENAEVADMLHAATVAIVGEVPLDRLRHAVPCFPTRSEIWLTLLAKAGV